MTSVTVTVRNDVNLEALAAFAEQARTAPEQAGLLTRARAIWTRGDAPMFKGPTRLSTGEKHVMEADLPQTFTGAERVPHRPAPVQQQLFGVATCFATSLLTVAAHRGLELEELRVSVETEANFSRLFADPNGPPPAGPLRVRVEVKPDTPEAVAAVREISRQAKECAPGVYMICHPMPMTIDVTGIS